MPRKASATPTDWEVRLLQVFWEKGPSTVDQVREALREDGLKRSDSAIRTLLKIMVGKGLLKVKPGEYASIYTAASSREMVEQIFYRHLVQTLFGGSESEFILRMFSQANLNSTTIKELEKMVRDHKKSA